jgi:hypothetical protein
MLKKIIRRGIRQARTWLAEEPAATSMPDSPWAHDRLNYLLGKLMKKVEGWRAHYMWGLLYGAYLGQALELKRVSTIEFGVAGGNGLAYLEEAALAVGEQFDIAIDVYGFDTGVGLPKPTDYRDLPNLYRESAFRMDTDQLRRRLKRAKLILGPIDETIDQFVESSPAPLAFISFDLDYYSSTMHAFRALEGDAKMLLPRVQCYFDDIMGFTFSEFTGERLAITEFNNSHPMRKISPIFGLRHFVPPPYDQAVWTQQMYITHIFDHPRYCQNDKLDLGLTLPLVVK